MRKIHYNYILFTITALLILTIAACGKLNEEKNVKQDKKDELILAIGGEPEDGFDPAHGWGRYGSPLFQSTLLTLDKDFNVENDLSVDYEVSDNGLEWLVKIRDDVKFSDGTELTANDVVFTFQTAQESDSIVDLNNLKQVTQLDDYTIKFTLNEPQSTFIYTLISTGIVPKHLYDETYNENPIGSGPFQLLQWNKGEQLIVVENPYYYGEKPFFKKLTFLFSTEETAFAMAKAGEVDVVSVPPSFAKEHIPGMKLVELDSVDNRGIMFPFVPAGDETAEGIPIGNDVTSDEAIRKAINIAIDRQALVDGLLDGFGTPAYSVADKLPWWNPETVINDNDMDKAESILNKAGWKQNEHGLREKDGLQATFTLLYPAGDQIRQSLSITVADMLEPLGIAVKTEGKSWDELGRLMYANPVLMGWGSHNPLELFHIYSSTTRGEGSYNANYYANQTVDSYMEKAMYTTDESKANKYWQKAQWDGETGFSAQGDAPWAWLVNLQHLYFVKDDLEIGEQKIQPHGHGWPITDFISKWHWREE